MKGSVPPQLLDVIRREKLICILGHADPDGDCIGAQVALGHFLRRIGKEAVLLSPGPFERPEIRGYEGQFASSLEPQLRARRPTAIVLDCSSLDRIGDLARDIAGLPVIVVDHHSAGRGFGEITYIDDSAPSVTLLVQRIMEELGYAPDAEEAQLLLFGLCTDTGFFRHIDSRDESVFEAIARLNGAGATPKQVYSMIYAGRPLASRILLGNVLARTDALFGGRILFTYETLEDKRTYGSQNRDSDSLYQLLQASAGCEAVIFIREEDEESCSVGLRSNTALDVGAIAQRFGGGGHRKAAGFRWVGGREEAKAKLVATLSSLLGALPDGAPITP